MKYILKPSLKYMTLVKIAAQLWNQEDIRKRIKNYDYSSAAVDFNNKWRKTEVQLEKRVFHLPLPESSHKELLCIIRPIGHQIKAWCTYYWNECRISIMPEQFSWTPEGSINWKRTAEMLIKSEDLVLDSCYKFACINCLEDEIPELFRKTPEWQESYLYFLRNRNLYFQLNKIHNLVEYWTYHLFGEACELDEVIRSNVGQNYSSHAYGFHCAVKGGNVVATEFFFNKLSCVERDTLLVEYAKWVAEESCLSSKGNELYAKIFHYLLIQMSENQQEEVFQQSPRTVILCFLDWPYQPLFMVVAERCLHLISDNDQCNLLVKSITSKIVNDCTDFNYRQLLHDLWPLIPLDYKRRIWAYISGETLSLVKSITQHVYS